MKLAFIKMHGLGNDFVLFDGLRERITLSAAQVRRIADRHFGVGCDQVLLIEPPRQAHTHVFYRIFNADGGEVEHCGNGVRCIARYLREAGIVTADAVVVETLKGEARVEMQPNGQVRVNMGVPNFAPESLPMTVNALAVNYVLDVAGGKVSVGAVSMGNPHAVLEVDNVDAAPVGTLGPLIEHHPRFPKGVNAGFMQIVDRSRIRLRVHERGAGETLACGTGACAAVAVGRRRGQLAETVDVELRGGHLQIQWQADSGAPLYMTGPAERVFTGEIEL